MPTLSAMFRLMDGYSTQISKIVTGTDAAMTKMLGASKAADKVNDSAKGMGKGFDEAAKKSKGLGNQLSDTAAKMSTGADTVTEKMSRTSKSTDKVKDSVKGLGKGYSDTTKKGKGFGDGLNDTSMKAQRADNSLRRLLGTVASMAAVKKGMDFADTVINTKARLDMITSSPDERSGLEADIFASANRSRGSYVEMANAAAKMRMLAGDNFTNNQEALGFTELLQKSLKVSGASQTEQNSAFLQITQAMAAGKLQGDEFRSVMENAPMVANAIAEYMGKSKGELKELSSQGVITSDIIKNAMFQAAGDINGKFDQMPMTFADAWTRIKNEGTRAFGAVAEKVNGMLNSDMGQSAMENLTGAIHLAAGATSVLAGGLGFVAGNLDVIAPIVIGLAGAWAAYNLVLGVTNGLDWAAATAKGIHTLATSAQSAATDMQAGATFRATVAQHGFNAALLACPVTWIVGGVLLLIAVFYAGVAAVNHFAGTSVSATGLIGAAFFTLGAFLYNSFIYPGMAGFALVANFIGNVFTNPVAAVKVLFLDMASTCIGYALNMAKAIESIINKIPGVTVDITSGLEGFKNNIDQNSKTIKDESGWKEFVKSPELLDYSVAAHKGYDAGSNLADKASNLFSGFNPADSGAGMDFSQFGTDGNPATVKGKGKGGAVKVENEEDINWMRKLAERDYIARIAQNTLAPNIKVEFTGPITKEADVDGVAAHMAEQLKEIIATAPEGVYP